MDINTAQTMLKTRITVAEKEGNHTEKSFLYELWKMSEELKELREKERS